MKSVNYFKINKNTVAKKTEFIISFGYPADLAVFSFPDEIILTLDKYQLYLPDDFPGKQDLIDLLNGSFEEIKTKSRWYIEQGKIKVSKNDVERHRFNNFLDTGKVIQEDRIIKEHFLTNRLESYYNQLKKEDK